MLVRAVVVVAVHNPVVSVDVSAAIEAGEAVRGGLVACASVLEIDGFNALIEGVARAAASEIVDAGDVIDGAALGGVQIGLVVAALVKGGVEVGINGWFWNR